MPELKISSHDVLAKVGSLTIENDLLRQQLAESRKQLMQATHPALAGGDNGETNQEPHEFSGRLAGTPDSPGLSDAGD